MRKGKSFIIYATATVAILMAGCTPKGDAPVLKNAEDTVSWVMGENVGKTMVSGFPLPINNEVFLQAVRYTLEDREQPMPDSVYEDALAYIMMLADASQRAKVKDQRQMADSLQQAYFAKLVAENSKVKQHPSGFYYEVLREGHGPKAKYAQRVKFDYRSYLIPGGEQYDQTYGQREPIVHVVGNPMFQGLIDGLQLMNAGSLYRFYFPFQMLANEQTSGSVKAYTPMIYDIELHEVFND